MTRQTGTRSYDIIKSITFWGASIISGLLNLQFFMALSKENIVMLCAMSVVLEGGKIITLVSANTLARIKRSASIVFYMLYLLMGLLAVVASLGFSQTAIYRSTAEVSSEISSIEQDLKTISDLEAELAVARLRYEEVVIDEAAVLRETRGRIALYESERQQANARINAYWSSGRDAENQWKEGYSQAEYAAIIEERALAIAKRDQAIAEANEIETGVAQKTMQERAAELQRRYDETTALLGTPIEITSRLREARVKERENMGSAVMFTLIMESLGLPDYATTFRFVMLMFAACLVEVLIYVFSPAVVIDRKMLNRFKRFLSKKDDVDELIKKFETENAKFVVDEKVRLTRDEKKQMKRMADEMTKAAVDRIEEKHRIEVGQLQAEVERYNALRTESEDSYRGLLDSHKDEVMALREKIAELEKGAVAKEVKEEKEVVDEADVEEEQRPRKRRRKKETTGPVDEWVVETVPTKETTVTNESEIVEKAVQEEPVQGTVQDDVQETVEVVQDQVPPIDNTTAPHEETFDNRVRGETNPEKTLVVELTEPTSATVVEKVEGDVLSVAGGEKIHLEPPKVKYRFGECTEVIRDKFVAYVTALVGDNERKSECADQAVAAKAAGLTTRQKEVFDQRLLTMTIGGVPLMRETKDGFVNDFTLDEIIGFTTQVVEKKNF